MPCLTPVLLMGYLLTLHPNKTHPTSLNSAVAEVQTCEVGWGANVKIAAETASVSVQHGFQWREGDWSATFMPNVGVGYLYDRVPELSGQVNFSLGASVMVGYQRSRVAVEYWHQSNACLGSQNAGVDVIGLMAGISF